MWRIFRKQFMRNLHEVYNFYLLLSFLWDFLWGGKSLFHFELNLFFFFLISMNFYIVLRINKVHIYSIGIYRFEKHNIICIQNVTLFLKKKIKYRIFSFKAEVIVTLRVLLKIMQFKNLIRNGILDLNR